MKNFTIGLLTGSLLFGVVSASFADVSSATVNLFQKIQKRLDNNDNKIEQLFKMLVITNGRDTQLEERVSRLEGR